MSRFLCECGKLAVWCYMPTCDWYPYYCKDCVPRGCSCNDEYEEEYDGKITTIKEIIAWVEEKGGKWIWKEEGKSISRVDEQGRLFPCVEFFYREDGWEVREDEIKFYKEKSIEYKVGEI